MPLDSLIEEISGLIRKNIDVSVAQWVDFAAKLNLFLMDLDSELIKAEMEVNRKRAVFSEDGLPNAKAETLVKATPEYEQYLKLKFKRERVIEQIKIAKKRTSIEPWNR